MNHKTPIQLIVGLGNPGLQYEKTRHNAGVWFIDEIVRKFNVSLHPEPKFKSLVGYFSSANTQCRLLIPTTFMNLSGQAIQTIMRFYKIPIEAILVAHDELDLPIGTIRLKQGGGHGGHNGLRDIINQLASKEFFRLRIGINHPGHKDEVVDYVLSRPSKEDSKRIIQSIDDALETLPDILEGNIQKAMKHLHS